MFISAPPRIHGKEQLWRAGNGGWTYELDFYGEDLMEVILYLFAMYGVTFGLQHKASSWWSKEKVFQKDVVKSLLKCTYCVGFHSGWLVYLSLASAQKFPFFIGDLFVYAFAGAAFSYSMDAYVEYLEEGGEYGDNQEG